MQELRQPAGAAPAPSDRTSRAKAGVARSARNAQIADVRLGEIWTLRQATRAGFLAGLAALLIWPVYAVTQETLRPAFVSALFVTAFCGASILFITIVDLLTVTRDRSILPARVFDLALGALLAIPSGAALASLVQ